MQKVSFELEDEIYGEARKLVGTDFTSLKELVLTAIRDDYKKKFGGWPPSEYPNSWTGRRGMPWACSKA